MFVAVAVALLAGPAAAHRGITAEFQAPVPLSLVLTGAALVVAFTAGLLAVGRVELGATRRGVVRVDPAPARALRLAARGAFFVAVALAVVAGVLGKQAYLENAATLFVWPVWLKGVGVLAMVVGSPWRVLSPWRALYDGLCRLEGADIALRAYPERLGAWPALGFFLVGVGIVENLTGVVRSPSATAAVVLAYATVMVVGGVAFGPAWFERADALAVLYRLFGRVAPLAVARTDDGGYDVGLRMPWTGCTRPVEGAAVVGFAVATVYTVSFDGFAATRTFQEVSFALRDLAGPGVTVGVVLYAAGFLGFVVGFLAVAAVTARLAGWDHGEHPAHQNHRDYYHAGALAPTVLPIAAAYEVAHNLAFVVVGAGLLVEVTAAHLGVALAVDPLGWLSVGAYWAGQVVLVVVGHVVAVVAAHTVVAARTERVGTAHLPLTLLMVGYTVLSLWIISRPLVA